MNSIEILPLDLSCDLNQITSWEKQYENNPKFDNIKHFILEDDTFFGLGEVVETNYEIFPIGVNERKYALSIKNEDKVIGFILALVDKLNTKTPELILQYVVMHPEYQHKGIATNVVNELIVNSEKYFDTKITDVFARIHKDNTTSKSLFKKLGFCLEKKDGMFLSATYNINENIKE